MHILIVANGYPTKRNPQLGCFEKDQAEALSKLGHKVTIAAVDGRFRLYRRKIGITQYKDGNLAAYTIYYFPLAFLFYYKLRFKVRELMMLKLFDTIVKSEGMPDVVYAHYMSSMAELALVKRKYNIPVVGMEHWSVLNKPVLNKKFIYAGNIAYGIVDKLLAVSPSLQLQLVKHFNKPSDVVFDMVNDIFFEASINENKNNKPFRFISVGSLNSWKAYDILLKAFKRLDVVDTELYIIGSGPDKEALMQLREELSLNDKVYFLGRKDKPAIIRELSEANAFVLASRGETFGVAYIEAMAMGLPVIATRCGGPESFMNEKCGLMVDVNDVEGLSAAMKEMICNIKSYRPLEIREYVRSRFSEEIIVSQIDKYLNEVIKNKSNSNGN